MFFAKESRVPAEVYRQRNSRSMRWPLPTDNWPTKVFVGAINTWKDGSSLLIQRRSLFPETKMTDIKFITKLRIMIKKSVKGAVVVAILGECASAIIKLILSYYAS